MICALVSGHSLVLETDLAQNYIQVWYDYLTKNICTQQRKKKQCSPNYIVGEKNIYVQIIN